MYSLRLATSGSTALGFALGRKTGGAAAAAAPGGLVNLVAPATAAQVGRRRSVSATSNAAAPVPGDQDFGMDPAKQQHHLPKAQAGEQQGNASEDTHKTTTAHGDVMTHSFGEGYSTRSDEEGFGGVYGQNDPVLNPGTEMHPNHPEYDKSQGSEVKEKEKARHLKDDKHAT
ncbi:uncharacterized protein LOC123451070 [Hordeum vulgare subsp. vulgare]|uniref:Predicted protein n=1 Tax=Hordeum vulgare subsp. vulgare TaxID=112509 RepID=F2CQY9_HORVV|nr:uncharacterized protein LOC123451070 [Hordeum vulgare subsp. vulgare]BAJ85260.1 predicted protein [Hordeum vulgare subsp. vulgare]